MTTSKLIKIIRIAIEAAFILTFVFLCIAVGVKNKHLKAYKQQIKAQIETIDSLKLKCDQLGAVDCITVNTTFVVNNKTVLGVNTNAINNVSRTYASWTKDEILHALDSLNNTR